MNKIKVCTKCGIEKELEGFSLRRDSKDGRMASCILCRRVSNQKRYSENKEKIKASHKVYRESHREEIKAHRKTDSYRESDKRSRLKAQNACRSRNYFHRNRHNIAVPETCSRCPSSNRVEAHHDDYNKPMEVKFLCQTCHIKWHKSNTPLNRKTGIFTDGK